MVTNLKYLPAFLPEGVVYVISNSYIPVVFKNTLHKGPTVIFFSVFWKTSFSLVV